MNKLLSIKISNYRSFFSEQTLKLDNKANSNITAIYGPNASGKSNTAKALIFIKEFIINSADAKNVKISYEPFLLRQGNTRPTSFELEFIHNNFKMRYGFSFNATKIISEKLVDLSGRKQKVIFSRREQEITNSSTANGFGFNQKLLSQTREATLLITKARENNNRYANIVFEFITHLNIITCGTPELRMTTYNILQSNPDMKKKVLEMLQRADFCIRDIVDYNFLAPEEIYNSFSNPNELMQQAKSAAIHNYGTIHAVRDKEDNIVGDAMFNLLKQESKGTNVFLDLATLMIESSEHDSVLYIDEFGLHLHLDICRFIIACYRVNSDSQLIFNNHNVLLMDMLSRDEIMFIGKRQNEESVIMPFRNLSPRKDESYSKRYDEGLYGFKPIISKVETK